MTHHVENQPIESADQASSNDTNLDHQRRSDPSSLRSFKRGAITFQNDLDEFVRVSVQTGIQNHDS